ncbi:MAG: hypothetical protein CYPHOPRED_005588 [Cyphobasidiales sp. Tagirdzhanova-0007]|nr:MAG: hypothetical protein CYPHOPRED_005588 [Cyphobasidiales sp. Tagirdzhanova-0007]
MFLAIVHFVVGTTATDLYPGLHGASNPLAGRSVAHTGVSLSTDAERRNLYTDQKHSQHQGQIRRQTEEEAIQPGRGFKRAQSGNEDGNPTSYTTGEEAIERGQAAAGEERLAS